MSDSSDDIRKKLKEFKFKIKDNSLKLAKKKGLETGQVKKPVLLGASQGHVTLQQAKSHLLQESSDEHVDDLLSSESFIISRVESSQTLFDLISFLKIYLKKLENSYSLDDLYTLLKVNSSQNLAKNITVEFLETYSSSKYTSSLGKRIHRSVNAYTLNLTLIIHCRSLRSVRRERGSIKSSEATSQALPVPAEASSSSAICQFCQALAQVALKADPEAP